MVRACYRQALLVFRRLGTREPARQKEPRRRNRVQLRSHERCDIMMSVMRTTLSIDDDILERLKQEAVRQKRSLRSVVNDTLRIGLEQPLSRRGSEPFRVEPFALGLKPGFRGLSLNQLYDQLEAESVTPETLR